MSSTMSLVIKALRRNWVTNLILLLVIGLVVWVAIADLSGAREKGEREEQPGAVSTISISASELGQPDWQVGTIQAGQNEQVYEVTIVGRNRVLLFRFKVDAFTAQPMPKGPEEQEGGAGGITITTTPMSPEVVAKWVTDLLPELGTGTAIRRGAQPFYKVPIMYAGLKIAEVKVDAVTKQVIPVEEKEAGEEEEGEVEKRGEKGKIMPKNLVLPLGFLSALIAIVSALYYSWKRSLYTTIRAVSGEAKAKAAVVLRQTLTLHITAGVIALGLAVLHVLNFTQKLHLTISWLTLAMMVTVVISGAFGKYFARTKAIRYHWRRFHVPYTVLFFLVLLLHALVKIHVLGD